MLCFGALFAVPTGTLWGNTKKIDFDPNEKARRFLFSQIPGAKYKKNLKFNFKKIVLHSKKIAPCVNSLFGTPKIVFSQDSFFFECNRDINF